MRRGSVSERFVKCSKPGCPCATNPKARHGPYYSWTRAVSGKTQSKFVPATQVEVVRRQVEAGRQFRDDVEAQWAICEQMADEELQGLASQAAEAVEKKGSKRASKPRLAKRSSA